MRQLYGVRFRSSNNGGTIGCNGCDRKHGKGLSISLVAARVLTSSLAFPVHSLLLTKSSWQVVAHFLRKEHIRIRDLGGSVLIVLGGITLVMYSPHVEFPEWGVMECFRRVLYRFALDVSILGDQLFRALHFEIMIHLSLCVCCVHVSLRSPQNEVILDIEELLKYIFSPVFEVYGGLLILLFIATVVISKRMVRTRRGGDEGIRSQLNSFPPVSLQLQSQRSVVMDLFLCAIVGSVTVMATKGFSTSIRLTILGDENAFLTPVTVNDEGCVCVCV